MEAKGSEYNLSKDYNQLYALICKGKKVVAFVDYSFKGLEEYPPSRDVCEVKRDAEFDISFGARGIKYGGVSEYWKNKKKEIDVFLSQCERMNVEWIVPNN